MLFRFDKNVSAQRRTCNGRSINRHRSLLRNFRFPPAGIVRTAISTFGRRVQAFSVSTVRSAHVQNAVDLVALSRLI